MSHSPGETFDTITKKLGKAWDDGNQLAKDLMKFAIKVGEKGTPENALMHQVIDEISGSSNKEKAKMAGYVVADLAIAVLITKGAGQMNKLVKSGELANLATKTIKAMEKIKDAMNKNVDKLFDVVNSIKNLGNSYELVTPEGFVIKVSKNEISSRSNKQIEKMVESVGAVVSKVGKPGSTTWKNAVKAIREGTGKGINFKAETLLDAEKLLKEARPTLEKRPTYESNPPKSGYEIHPIDNDFNMPHIKWRDWSNGKSSGADGHIFF